MGGGAIGLLLLLTTMSPASGTTDHAPRSLRLERGIALLEEDKIEAAIEMLQSIEGNLGLDDLRRSKESLGIALAYADRKDQACQVFKELLAIAPDHVLPYTISPRATFVFEQARAEMAQQRAIEVELNTPLTISFDRDIEVTLTSRANPFELAQRWQLCFRQKSASADYQCRPIDALPLDRPIVVALPAVSTGAAAAADAARAAPVVLQLALSGFDRAGNEVYRWPSRARPKEVLVGVDVPAPWYSNVWLWAGLGSGLAVAAAAVVAAIVLTQPTTAQLTGELAP